MPDELTSGILLKSYRFDNNTKWHQMTDGFLKIIKKIQLSTWRMLQQRQSINTYQKSIHFAVDRNSVFV